MLKKGIQQKCLTDIDLFGKVAKACNKTPYNTVRMLQRNISKELANVDVVSVIKEHTGLSQEQILIKK
jgi:hypothetical protein